MMRSGVGFGAGLGVVGIAWASIYTIRARDERCGAVARTIFETVRNFLGKAARLAYIAERARVRIGEGGAGDANRTV
jgi:hypothetical protein